MTKEQLEQEEAQRYPDQSINWEMEKEVKPVPVLLDIAAGVRTNKMMNVFHLPHDTAEKWVESIKEVITDAAKTLVGEDTSVGVPVAQQHITQWLQEHASQQQILFFASNFLYHMANDMAAMRAKTQGLDDLLGLLQHLHGDGDKH